MDDFKLTMVGDIRANAIIADDYIPPPSALALIAVVTRPANHDLRVWLRWTRDIAAWCRTHVIGG